MEQEGSERRRSPRVFKVSLIQANSFLIGNTQNISRHGARIELHEPLPADEPVTLDLSVGEKVLEIPARVVYLHQGESGLYTIGLEFKDLSESQLELLDEFLASA